MRRQFVVLLIVLLGATGVVALLERDPGYILVAYGSRTLEMTVLTGIGLLVGGFFLLYVAVRLWRRAWRTPRKVSRWLDSRSLRLSHSRTTRGMIAFIEGRWKHARKILVSVAERSDTPLLYYLMAARASHALGDEKGLEKYLRQAEESTSGADLAVGLTQAEMQLDNGQLEQALATLMRVRAVSTSHPEALKLLMQVYQGLGDWESLRKLLPDLRKAGVIDGQAFIELERTTFASLLKQAGQKGDTSELEKVWRQLPAELANDAAMACVYVELLVSAGASQQAEKVIRRSLRRSWDEKLVGWYGRVHGEDPHKQLIAAEAWLKERSNSAVLMLCLGRLSLANSLWGKARDYFESSLKLEKSAEAYAELGRLLANLGETEKSIQYLQLGLQQGELGLPALPMPDKKLALRSPAARRA